MEAKIAAGGSEVAPGNKQAADAQTPDNLEVARAQTDPAAFSALYRKYYPKTLTYAFRRVGNRDCAEEIVAGAFVKLVGALPSYRRSSVPFQAWVYRIVTNEVNRHFRATNRYRRALLELFPRRVRSRGADRPRLDHVVEFEQIRRALNTLPSKYATVLSLRYFEQLTNMEIAEILGVPGSTVRTRIERGVEKLRVRLTQSD